MGLYSHAIAGCSAVGSAPRLGRGGPRFESAHPDCLRASPSGKASAFQADIRRFESGRPLKLRACSSTAEQSAHNRPVPGSNPGGPI